MPRVGARPKLPFSDRLALGRCRIARRRLRLRARPRDHSTAPSVTGDARDRRDPPSSERNAEETGGRATLTMGVGSRTVRN